MAYLFKGLKYLGLGLIGIVVLAAVGLLVAQRMSDGPMGFVQGGAFTSGEWVEGPVEDWSFAEGQGLAFELVGAGTSRYTGMILQDGELYIPCDLGYGWNRGEDPALVARIIYWLKSWHEEAVEDGRAVLRIDGRRYQAQLSRVSDPVLIDVLKGRVEALARSYFEHWPPPGDQAPNDMWFFRVDQPAAD